MEKNKFKMEEEGRRWGVSEGVKDVEVGCKGLGVEKMGKLLAETVVTTVLLSFKVCFCQRSRVLSKLTSTSTSVRDDWRTR